MEDWTEQQAEELFAGIYSGQYTPDRLPSFLFAFTFGAITPLIEKAFKGGIDTLPLGTRRYEIAEAFRYNINIFSGAKTWQEARALTDMVFLPDGTKRPLSEFMKFARTIDSQYNRNWLRTEQDAAFARAQAADRWLEIEEQADILPLLRYRTVADDRVRPEHIAQDGVTLPVDHRYWDTWYPPNDWGCRCDVDQLDDVRESTIRSVPKNPVRLFADNPAKSRIIFKENGHGKHPYFRIPNRDKYRIEQDGNNFGLGFL